VAVAAPLLQRRLLVAHEAVVLLLRRLVAQVAHLGGGPMFFIIQFISLFNEHSTENKNTPLHTKRKRITLFWVYL
jgi:hypothetical protein